MGVFASCRIEKDEFILEYEGDHLTKKETASRRKGTREQSIYVMDYKDVNGKKMWLVVENDLNDD